jgi:hypothetical protein
MGLTPNPKFLKVFHALSITTKKLEARSEEPEALF